MTTAPQTIGDTSTWAQAEMIISWIVPGDFTGWVVQEVTMEYSVTNIHGETVENQLTESQHYTEAWKVENGAFVADTPNIDQFRTNGFSSKFTSGSATITGVAKLHAGDGPNDWGSDIDESGGLPAMNGTPDWWNSSGGVTHQLSLSWQNKVVE